MSPLPLSLTVFDRRDSRSGSFGYFGCKTGEINVPSVSLAGFELKVIYMKE